jgi:DNA/RNA-binding domain of Phe-tRNA-synthetase-like protein
MKQPKNLQIIFSSEIKRQIPNLKIGLLRADSVTVKTQSAIAEREFEDLVSFIREKFNSSAPADDPVISNVRRMYRRIGWEPTRYRPSSEAMIRRILKNLGLYKINNLVDLGNIASARFHLPLGLYDTKKIDQSITIAIGKHDETYEGMSIPLIHAHGKLVLRDAAGVFGNPTADSKRTCISENTSDVCGIFFTPPEVSSHYLHETLNFLKSLYQLDCPETSVISEVLEAGYGNTGY